MILGFSGTELAEVFSGLGNYIGEEFELNTAEWFAWVMLGIAFLASQYFRDCED